MVFLGGFGSISGAVLGALIIEPLTLWMNTQPAFSGSISEVIIGAILLLVVLFMPRGIIPTGREFIAKLRTRGRPAVVPATTIGPVSTGTGPSASSVSSGGAR
jgi:branched-chain amino acid transport system permease protein